MTLFEDQLMDILWLQDYFRSIDAPNNFPRRGIIWPPVSLTGCEIQPTIPVTSQSSLDTEWQAPDY